MAMAHKSKSKASTCNAGDVGSIPGLGRSPGEGKGSLTPVFWPGEFHGLYRSWTGLSDFHFHGPQKIRFWGFSTMFKKVEEF